MTYEDATHEYKERHCSRVPKEVVAFANTDGGTLTLGADSRGNPLGLDDPDAEMAAASNAIRDAIAPDVTPFVSYSHRVQDGLPMVDIEVERGDQRPYYLKQHGMTPRGVQVRDGASSVPASPERIVRLLREDSGTPWEEHRSREQGLTFAYASRAFKDRSIALDDTAMGSLGLLGRDGLYTNLALLLSDQCPTKTRCATFSDPDGVVFSDRADITGSVLQQLDDSLAYLRRGASLVSSFEGNVRTDYERRPAGALAEAIANAVMHRDYSVDGDTQVSVFENRTEVLSHGGLVDGQTLEEALRGSSKFRNKRLSEVLMRLGYVEAFGTGLRRIRTAYNGSSARPAFDSMPNSFLVTLPDFVPEKGNRDRVVKGVPEPKTEQDAVLRLARVRGVITRQETQELLGLGQTQTAQVLRGMCDAGLLQKVGGGRSTRYVAAGQ